MTKKELIYLLCNEHNEQTIKLLRDFPTILRDLRAMEDYDEAFLRYDDKRIRAKKQWSRDFVVEQYNMGINTFYKIRKRVEWILAKMQ